MDDVRRQALQGLIDKLQLDFRATDILPLQPGKALSVLFARSSGSLLRCAAPVIVALLAPPPPFVFFLFFFFFFFGRLLRHDMRARFEAPAAMALGGRAWRADGEP